MDNMTKNIALIKSILLSKGIIKFSDNYVSYTKIQKGNLYQKEWIFLRLNNNSRVRLVYDINADLSLELLSDGTYQIIDTNDYSIIIKNIKIENVLVHAPEQLFFVLYKKCSAGCKFCPLATRTDDSHYSLDLIYSRLNKINKEEIKSIGLTSSSPSNLSISDIVDEIIFLIKKIRKVIKPNIPIGVSVKTPSVDDLFRLKENGVSEIRLNLEIYNDDLAKKLMPSKRKDDILQSIQNACDVFGKGFVSSNILIGVGENDDDILNGVKTLAHMGAVATLYPYDPIDNPQYNFYRPSAERLHLLATEQKKIFDHYEIDTNKLQTMCCSCAASHIFPGKDL